jgi:hypothetical protein
VYDVLDRLHAANPISELGQGKAFGADMLAEHWCRSRGVACVGFQAQWDREGKSAGFIRNKAMLATMRPDLVVAFPGGRGTRDCVSQAERRGIFVYEVDQPWP